MITEKDLQLLNELYDKELDGLVQRPSKQENLEYNYAYYPVVFKSEEELLNVFAAFLLT